MLNHFLYIQIFSIEDMYKKSINAEVEAIKELRLSNENNITAKLCRCGQNPIDAMFQCELCHEWLHCMYYTQQSLGVPVLFLLV